MPVAPSGGDTQNRYISHETKYAITVQRGIQNVYIDLQK